MSNAGGVVGQELRCFGGIGRNLPVANGLKRHGYVRRFHRPYRAAFCGMFEPLCCSLLGKGLNALGIGKNLGGSAKHNVTFPADPLTLSDRVSGRFQKAEDGLEKTEQLK